MTDLVGRTLGKYRLVAQLGRGGMAEVYKAYQSSLDRYVAIKVLRSRETGEADFPKRFEREATAVARLRHPNIVQVYDFDVEDDLYYMVMEFIEGPTLKAELEARSLAHQPFRLEEIAHIFIALTSAVDYAHSRSMVHRDVKPANVMFSAEGQVVLTDFGVARILGGTAFTTTGGLAGTPAYMSPEQGQGEHGDTRSDIYSLGVILYEMVTGRIPYDADTPYAVILKHINEPLPLPTAINPSVSVEVEQAIVKAMSKAPGDRYQTAGEMAQALREAIGLKADQTLAMPISTLAVVPDVEAAATLGLPPSCPYRGLLAFREEDAPFFVGREDFAERLVEAVWDKSFVAVIGPSGSGKSSVVFAGLIPRLRQGAALRQAGKAWAIAAFRPGIHPFHALASALLPFLEAPGEEADRLVALGKLADALRQGDASLDGIVEQILTKNPDSGRLLLVADPFEELYTLCPEPNVRQRFLQVLLEATASRPEKRESPLVLILSLRADFIGQAFLYRPFADALQDATLLLGPMTPEQLRRAIENPAAKQNAAFETGLVEHILQDLGGEPGNLSPLQFVLTALWEGQTSGILTHATYGMVEGVKGALGLHADEVFSKLSQAEQIQARRIFMQLVRPGEGTQDTRRLATHIELGENDWAVVQRLAEGQLLILDRDPFGHETAEIAHEALIQNWGRLQTWADVERAFQAWHRRLQIALDPWEAGGRDESALLSGGLLGEAEDWLNQRAADLSETQREFIRAGLAHRERKAFEREARRQHELEAAEQWVEAEKRRLRAAWQLRRWVSFWVSAFIVVIAVIVVAFALIQRSDLHAQVVVANGQASTAQAASTLAAARQATAEAAGTQAMVQQAAVMAERDQAVQEQTSALSAQATAEAEAAVQATAAANAVQQSRAAQQQARIALSRELAAVAVNSLAVDPERSVLLALQAVLATYSVDHTVTAEAQDALLRAVQFSQSQLTLSTHEGAVNRVAFSPDGILLATASEDGTAKVWEAASGKELLTLSGHAGAVNGVAFSPDGRLLATASSDKTVKVWDLVSGKQVLTLSGHAGRVYRVAFSADGKRLATASGDGSAKVWEAASGKALLTLRGHAGRVLGVAFSPDGALLATAGEDGAVKVWDTATGQELLTRSGRTGAINDITFSPDGTQFATASADGTVKVWGISTGEVLVTLQGHTGAVNGVAFNADGARLATASSDKTVKVWEAATGQELFTLSGYAEAVNDVAFSSDGAHLATASADKAAHVYVLDVEDLVALARTRVTRSLTTEECQEFLHLDQCPAAP